MTRLCFISDTHEQHGQLTQRIIGAQADVLVHCGDFTGRGHLDKIRDFAEWCAMLVRKGYVKHVVTVAGNHDLTLDATQPNVGDAPVIGRLCLEQHGVAYLEDSGAEVAGLRFYGSPWTPRFFDWGFQLVSDAQSRRIFGAIPECDVLVTHGPPLGIRDLVPSGQHAGSRRLLDAVRRVRPRIHAFGHIHCQYGITAGKDTLYINAATCTEAYRPTNAPIVVDLEAA